MNRLVIAALLLAVTACASAAMSRGSAKWVASQHAPGDSWCDLKGAGGVSVKRCYWKSPEGSLWLVTVTTCDRKGCRVDSERKLLWEEEDGE